MPRRRDRLRVGLAALLAALVLAGCGGSSSSPSSPAGASSSSAPAASSTTTTSSIHFAKTKFVLHAGLAFGAFHRYIYKPFRAGDFAHPFTHKLTLVKAALAAAFIHHELVLAFHDAQADPTLSKLVAPITGLENRLHGLSGQVRHGDGSQVGAANGSIGQIEGQASSAGQPIREQAPAAL